MIVKDEIQKKIKKLSLWSKIKNKIQLRIINTYI